MRRRVCGVWRVQGVWGVRGVRLLLLPPLTGYPHASPGFNAISASQQIWRKQAENTALRRREEGEVEIRAEIRGDLKSFHLVAQYAPCRCGHCYSVKSQQGKMLPALNCLYSVSVGTKSACCLFSQNNLIFNLEFAKSFSSFQFSMSHDFISMHLSNSIQFSKFPQPICGKIQNIT